MAIVALIFLLIFALIPAFIASGKGRSFILWYLYGLLLFFFAFIHALLIKPNENAKGMRKCPKCESIISTNASICPSCRTDFSNISSELSEGESKERGNFKLVSVDFDGEMNLSLASYQLYLTRKYNIEKNNTLDKFILGNNVFNTLEESLTDADRQHREEISKQKEELRIAEEERAKKIISDREIAQKQAVDNELRHQKFLEEEARLAPARAAFNRNLAIISSIIILGFISWGTKTFYDQKIERDIREEAERIQQQKIIELKKIAETESLKLEEKIKNELKEVFSTGNFFGFKMGENNLEKLVGLTRHQVEKDYISRNYKLTCRKNQCEDILKQYGLYQEIEEFVFYYCVPDASESKGNKYYKLAGIKLQLKEGKDNLNYIKYGDYVNKNKFLPQPPKDVKQNFTQFGNLISLDWKKDGSTTNTKMVDYRISDICNNRRNYWGGRP
jgi:hypothetical protein